MTQRLKTDLDPRDRAQVDDIVDLVRSLLVRGDAVGAYLHGSAVLGGLRPSSDLDVLVVSTRPTTPADKRALIDRLLRISGPNATSGSARSIELTIVVQSDVRPWHYPPSLDFLYGDWLRPGFERGDLKPWLTPNPDLAVVLAVVLLGDAPLFGPRPADVLDRIPQGDLVAAMLAGIPDLLGDLESDTRNVILTLARIWMTKTTGAIQSKDAAADWSLARLPEEHRAVVARARAIYVGEEPERWEDLLPCVLPHAEYVVRQIRALG